MLKLHIPHSRHNWNNYCGTVISNSAISLSSCFRFHEISLLTWIQLLSIPLFNGSIDIRGSQFISLFGICVSTCPRTLSVERGLTNPWRIDPDLITESVISRRWFSLKTTWFLSLGMLIDRVSKLISPNTLTACWIDSVHYWSLSWWLRIMFPCIYPRLCGFVINSCFRNDENRTCAH